MPVLCCGSRYPQNSISIPRITRWEETVIAFTVQEKGPKGLPAAPVDCISDEIAAAFRRAYPSYARTRRLDELRASDYARLDEQGQVYLDYTGGSLYADSQLRAHMELLRRCVFGNPHSHNSTSQAATELMEQARSYVL